MDLLNSNPPWPENESPAPPTRRNEGASLKQNGQNGLPTPSSTSMQMQNSQNSVYSSASDDFTPKPLQRHMKAKDERADIGRERQINHDLVDFFASAPPPTELSLVKEEEASLSKKKGGLRGFMSKIGGSKKDDGSSSPTREDLHLSRKPSLSSMPSGSMGRKSTRSVGTSSAAEFAPATTPPPPSTVSNSPPSPRIASPIIPQPEAPPPFSQSSRSIDPDLPVPTISLSRHSPSAPSSTSPSHTSKAPVVPGTNGTSSSSRDAILAQPLVAPSDATTPLPPTPAKPTPSAATPAEPIFRKVSSSRSIASTDTGVPASFKTADSSSRSGSSETQNGVSPSGAAERMPVVARAVVEPATITIPDDFATPPPSKRTEVIVAVGGAAIGAVAMRGGEREDVPNGVVASLSDEEASTLDAPTLSGKDDSASSSLRDVDTDPIIIITDEADGDVLPRSSSLETLKLLMAAASSPQECIVLLDSLIRQEKEEQRAGHRYSLVEAAKMDANAEAVAEQARFDERVQGSLVEFLLGGNDETPYSPPVEVPVEGVVEEEVAEDAEVEETVAEAEEGKDASVLEDEAQVDGDAEARMPGEFTMGSAL